MIVNGIEIKKSRKYTSQHRDVRNQATTILQWKKEKKQQKKKKKIKLVFLHDGWGALKNVSARTYLRFCTIAATTKMSSAFKLVAGTHEYEHAYTRLYARTNLYGHADMEPFSTTHLTMNCTRLRSVEEEQHIQICYLSLGARLFPNGLLNGMHANRHRQHHISTYRHIGDTRIYTPASQTPISWIESRNLSPL